MADSTTAPSTTSGAGGARKRIAVVTIHGVADQSEGATLRAFVSKLVSAGRTGADAIESWRWLRPRLPVDTTVVERDESVAIASVPWPTERSETGAKIDADVRRHFGTPPTQPFRSLRITDTRSGEGPALDMFELYWADLSRVETSTLALVGAAISLLFHLPAIGLRAVHHALTDRTKWCEPPRSAPRRALDLACVLLQYAVTAARIGAPTGLFATLGLAIALVPMGFALEHPGEAPWVAAVLFGTAVPLGLNLVDGQAWKEAQRVWLPPIFYVLVCALSAAVLLLLPESWTPPLLVLAFGVCWLGLGWLLARRFIVRPRVARPVIGMLAGIAAVAVASCVYYVASTPPGTNDRVSDGILHGLENGVELAYVVTSVMWIVAAALGLASSIVARVAIRRLRAARPTPDGKKRVVRASRSFETAFLALVALLVSFLLVSLPVAAGLFHAIDQGHLFPDKDAFETLLAPLIETFSDHVAARDKTLIVTVASMLDALVRASGTRMLPFVLVVLGAIAIAAVVMFAPALQAELRSPRLLPGEFLAGESHDHASEKKLAEAQDLAKLLDGGTRWLPIFAREGLAGCVVFVVIGFAFETLCIASDWGWLPEPVCTMAAALNVHTRVLADLSGGLIFGVGLLVAGSASLLAFPSRVREVLAPARPALDILLDVDGYLREDDTGPSVRAQLLGRTYALLAELAASPEYDALVVLSHSQGTVIATDALRLLRGRRPCVVPYVPIHLITFGSPLANLYHRFLPAAFEWVERGASAPEVELGVEHWTNVYGGADYVGREVDRTELLGDQLEIPPSSSKRFEQIPAGPIGHVRYWDTNEPAVDAVVWAFERAVERASGGEPPAFVVPASFGEGQAVAKGEAVKPIEA